jgi:hypothetical protein
VSAPNEHILYDMLSRLTEKVDALVTRVDDRLSNLTRDLARHDAEISQLRADRDTDRQALAAAEADRRTHKRAVWFATLAALVAVLAAVLPLLIGG